MEMASGLWKSFSKSLWKFSSGHVANTKQPGKSRKGG